MKQFIRFIKEWLTFNKIKHIPLFNNNIFKIITLNLRIDKLEDGENNWVNRRNKIIEYIKKEQPHILCSQEVMPTMYKYLIMELGMVFDSYGIESFTGKKLNKSLKLNSSGNIILYDKHKYNLIDKGLFWLSDIPNKPSSTWGNEMYRTCIYIGLQDKNSKELLYVFNTHFDHVSEEARNKSSKLILSKIKEIAKDANFYLAGDFNTEIQELMYLNKYLDSTNNYNSNKTFNSFKNKLTKTIDAIYFKFGNVFKIDIPNVKLSDHTPVILCKQL